MRHVTSRRGNSYEILTGADICDPTLTPKTQRHLERMMEIDTDVYGGEDKGEDCVYIGDIGGYLSRFGYVEGKDGSMRLDPSQGVVDNIVAVAQEGKILGYVNYLTMGDELHHEIVHPDVEAYLEDPARRDDGIRGTQLQPWTKNGENNLFVLSVAIDKAYQDTDVIHVLTNGLLDELRQKQKDGYDVTSISMDTVSDHGEKFSKMLRCDIAEDGGEKLILPAPDSDESGHDVTVRVCEGENMRLLLTQGFDFSQKDGPNKATSVQRGHEFDGRIDMPQTGNELDFH